MPKETDPDRLRALLRVLRDPASNVVLFKGRAFDGSDEPDDIGLNGLLPMELSRRAKQGRLKEMLAEHIRSGGKVSRVEYTYEDGDPETIYEFRLTVGSERAYVKTEWKDDDPTDPILIVRSVKRQNWPGGSMAKRWENWPCHVCRQKSLRRVKQPYEYEVSHDGRPPVKIHIPDLEVIACTNPDCQPEHPGDTIIEDDAAIWRITVETYRQLGLLTPEEIKAGRERLRLSQQELAELLGLGGNSLSRWENGRVYQARSLDTLLRMIFLVPEARSFLWSLRGKRPEPRPESFRYLLKAQSSRLTAKSDSPSSARKVAEA